MEFTKLLKRNIHEDLRRTSHLTDKCIRDTLLATTLTTFAPLLALFTDTLFVGNMIGADAICALSVTNPIITFCYVLLYILHMGANVLASNKLGCQEYKEAKQYFTVSIISTVSLAVVLFIILMVLRGTICSTWSPNENIQTYTYDYSGLIFFNIIPLSIASTLNYFISGEGNPKQTSRAVLIGAFVNILLDPLFIGVFQWGVKGAAAATLISTLTNIAVHFYFFRSGKSIYKLTPVKNQVWKILRENIVYGIGFNIINICTNLFMILANIIVAKSVTHNLYLAWGICVQIQYFLYSFCLGTTTGSVFLGSSLIGEGDWEGVRRLAWRVLEFQILFFGSISVLMWAFPAPIAWVFGIHDWASGMTFRLTFGAFSIYLACYCFTCAYTNIFYMMKHVWMKIIIVICFMVCVIISFSIGSEISPDALWYSMIIGSIFPVLATVFYVWTRHLKNPTLTRFTMIPSWPVDPQVGATIYWNQKDYSSIINRMTCFIEACELPKEKEENAIRVIQLIINMSFDSTKYNKSGNSYDFRLVDQGQQVKLFTKIYGKPLNTIMGKLKTQDDEEIKQYVAHVTGNRELIISLVDEWEYRYVYSMNETILQWNKDK